MLQLNLLTLTASLVDLVISPAPQSPTKEPEPPALRVQSLSITIHGQEVVSDISFHVPRAETLALVGESGCGKSVTALSLMNLLPRGANATSATMQLADDELNEFSEKDWQTIRGKRVGMIFQDPGSALDPLMTVGKQIAEALRLRGIAESSVLREVACEMLSHVGISDPQQRLDQYPFELSGGMCQRVMIVIALAAKAELLIADEPTTALDVTIQAQILSLMETLQRETGTSILLITHDMGVVAETAHSVSVMYAGQIVEYGPTLKILNAPAHPYTRALLSAIPRLDTPRGASLDVIEGTVPEPSDWPLGCRFAPRCPHKQSACQNSNPLMQQIDTDHGAACFRLGDPLLQVNHHE